MPQSRKKKSEEKSKRYQRRRALKFSLAMAVPLALVMAGTLTWLKISTPQRPANAPLTDVQPASSAQTTPGGTAAPVSVAPDRDVPSYSPQASAAKPPAQAAQPEPDTPPDFELETIATALSRLNLDENGRVKVDEQARSALEAAFLQPDTPMDEARFSELQTLVEAGLQGEAGRQAAAVAERFYRYSNAYREVADTFGYHGELGNLEANFEQLSRLRQTYLGDELTESLYGAEETLMRYTLNSMRIQADQTLSPEQKQARQEQLRKQVPTTLIGGKKQAGTP